MICCVILGVNGLRLQSAISVLTLEKTYTEIRPVDQFMQTFLFFLMCSRLGWRLMVVPHDHQAL